MAGVLAVGDVGILFSLTGRLPRYFVDPANPTVANL
jgi:hypothetical protein